MLFDSISNIAKSYPNKLAIDSITYGQLISIIKSRPYSAICSKQNYEVILDILVAAYNNKPIFVLPKYNQSEIQIPNLCDSEFNLYLYSSGSTGVRKQIRITEGMLLKNAENAIKCQNLNSKDKILTVCSLNHTGGLNAQTFPGLIVGSHILVREFNAFNFIKLLSNESITVTHLIPIMIDSLIKVNSKQDIGSNLRLVMAGSDCVHEHHIKYWTDRDVNFISNYGLTEAGPIIINHQYNKYSDFSIFKHGIPLGTKIWCDYKLENNELFLCGDEVNQTGWLSTGDCVTLKENYFMYSGRVSSGCTIIPKQYQ